MRIQLLHVLQLSRLIDLVVQNLLFIIFAYSLFVKNYLLSFLSGVLIFILEVFLLSPGKRKNPSICGIILSTFILLIFGLIYLIKRFTIKNLVNLIKKAIIFFLIANLIISFIVLVINFGTFINHHQGRPPQRNIGRFIRLIQFLIQNFSIFCILISSAIIITSVGSFIPI